MAAPTSARYPQWEYDLLNTLGIKPNNTNLQFLNLWARSEGVAATNNNPLAITDPNNRWQHSGIIAPNNGFPVYAFPTEQIGVQATASFLQAGYGNVIQALRTNDLGAMFASVNGSGWCRGCQGGKYPVAVANALGGNAPADVFQGGSAGAGAQQTYQGKVVGCDPGGGIHILGFGNVFTGCQVKAITAGLLIGAGAVVMLFGVSQIASGALVPAAVNRLTGGVSGRLNRAGQAVSEAEIDQPEAAPKPPSQAELRRQAQAEADAQAAADDRERQALWDQMDAALFAPRRGKAPAEAAPPRRPTPTRPRGSAGTSPARKPRGGRRAA